MGISVIKYIKYKKKEYVIMEKSYKWMQWVFQGVKNVSVEMGSIEEKKREREEVKGITRKL